ncbi:MAG: methyltransferase domain-containing protein [Rhodospirillaceae bacterium]|nr:methyltransferase domain-containing protein [Rhodospirillaceae bacterium]
MPTALPATKFPGAVPTLNGRGFMLEALDDFAQDFVDAAARAPGESLDMGCAYGIATLAALDQGARMCACDMEPRHLEVLAERAPPEQKSRLRTVVGTLPDVQFPPGSFNAILASRVIHFLSGDDIRAVLGAMFTWLVPGGRLFVVADTPYMPGWNQIAPVYESAKAKGDAWPGFIPDFARYRQNNTDSGAGPKFLNTLDAEILARECARAGFAVERAGFFGLQRLGAAANGREHAGCAARRPL